MTFLSGSTTWLQAVAEAGFELCWWFTIEGYGPHNTPLNLAQTNNDGRYRFCNVIPEFGKSTAHAGLWKPVVRAMPDVLAERLPELGGVAELGGVSFALVDEDDFITSIVNTETRAVAQLEVALTPTATDLDPIDSTNLPNSTVMYIDEEAIMMVTPPSDSGFAVRRGTLGTDAQSHAAGAAIFISNPSLAGRRVTMWLAPKLADSYAAAVEVGTYEIENIRWAQAMNSWVFDCRSVLVAVDRLSPLEPRQSVLSPGDASLLQNGRTGAIVQTTGIEEGRRPENHWTSSQAQLFYALGDEILGGSFQEGATPSSIDFRGLCESSIASVNGGETLRQVMTASFVGSSFRYSPGPSPSTDRTSGTWIETREPLRILLCILTSSRTADDALELVNFETGQANYSSLLVGYGAGFQASEIDWPSWNAVISRTEGFQMPNIVWGADEVLLREWVDENILVPLGVSMVVVDGKLALVRAQVPAVGSEIATIDVSSVLERGSTGPGVDREPAIDAERSLTVAKEFAFSVGPNAKTLGTAQILRSGPAGESVVVAVPGASTRDTAFWAAEASARVQEIYRPRTRIVVDVSLSFWAAKLGEFLRVTLAEIPNFEGARSVDGLAWLREREVRFEIGRGVYLQLTLDLLNGDRVFARRIGPSAKVQSVSGNVATITANRFTEIDISGLPNNDALVFNVGDVCQLRSAGGVAISGTQTISSISQTGLSITFDGNWSGGLVAGAVVLHAAYDSVVAAQRDRYAFMADTAFNLGSADAEPDIYADG